MIAPQQPRALSEAVVSAIRGEASLELHPRDRVREEPQSGMSTEEHVAGTIGEEDTRASTYVPPDPV